MAKYFTAKSLILPLLVCACVTSPSFAAGKGGEHSSEHAQSGQGGDSGQGSTHGQGGSQSEDHANKGKGNEASLAGAANAAHASVNGFLHASDDSELGRLRAYAEAKMQATQDQSTIEAFQTNNPDYATLTDDEIAALDGGSEYLAALADLTTAQTSVADAFAATGAKPGSESYVDGLLTKYYTYLATQ